MHLPFILPLLSIIPSLTLASSLPTYANQTINITGPYYLKTKVLPGGDTSKDNLYVWAYHTGAGTNDAVLGSKDHARPAYLNNSIQQFDLGTAGVPWSFSLPYDLNYAGKPSFA